MKTMLDRFVLILVVGGFGYVLVLIMPSLNLGLRGTAIAWGTLLIGTYWAWSRTQNLDKKNK